jgi:hypothetical protein
MATPLPIAAVEVPEERVERIIADEVRRVRFGEVKVTIHDGEVVQIDRTEKTRLPRSK